MVHAWSLRLSRAGLWRCSSVLSLVGVAGLGAHKSPPPRSCARHSPALLQAAMKPYGEQQQAAIPGMVPLPQQQSQPAFAAPTGGYVPQQPQGYVPQQGYAPQQGYPPQQAPQQGYLAPGQPMGYPPPPQPQMGYAPQPQYGQPQYAQGPAPGMYAQPGQAHPGQPGMQQPGNDIVMVPQTSGCCCCEETKMVPMRTGGAMGNPMYGQQGMYQPQPMYGRQQQGGGGAGMAMGVVGGVMGGMMLMDAMDGDLFD